MIEQIKIELERLTLDKIRQRIIDLDLVDTGKMLESMNVNIVLTSSGFDFEVSSVDYWKYVDGEHNILDWVIEQSDVSDLITELFSELIFKELEL